MLGPTLARMGLFPSVWFSNGNQSIAEKVNEARYIAKAKMRHSANVYFKVGTMDLSPSQV